MKRTTLTLLVCLFACFGTEAPATAQKDDACKPEENVIDCMTRRFNQEDAGKEEEKAAATERAKAAGDKVQQKPKADQSPGSAGTVRDVLPVFFTSVGLGSVSEEDETLTLTFNPNALRNETSQWSLEARIRDPEPLDKLLEKAAQADRTAVEKEISEELGDFDDVEGSLSWTSRTEKLGRDFYHHSELASGFLEELSRPFFLPDKEKARQQLVDTLGERPYAQYQGTKFKDLPLAVAREFEQLVSEALTELATVRKGLKLSLVNNSYFKLANLVDNQPQLSATLSFRQRDDLVGQDSLKANVTYEWGEVNVNRFKKWCGKTDNYANATVDADCLAAYWTAKGAKAEYLPRFKFSLDYEDLDDLDVSFTQAAAEPMAESGEPAAMTPTEPLTLMLASTEKLVGSVGFGRYLRIDEDGNQRSRYDLEARYEWVEDDTTRNKRYVATATYTQRVSDGASASLGFVYASDPEFRGEVEKEFSARAGLKFKLDRKEANQ